MQTFLEDIEFAFRNFRKRLGVTLLIVVTLAMGIGANSAIFSMVYNVLLGPLPFADGDRLVRVHTNRPAVNQFNQATSVQTLFDYRNQSETLSDVIEYHQMSFTLLGHGDPSYVQTGVVSWDYFNVLGIQPLLGRTFLSGEDEPGSEPLILLSYRYWNEQFGADPGVIGTNLQMNNKVHQVIGVLPPMPAYPLDNDIWVAASTCPGRGSDFVINNRAMPFVDVYGKLKPGVSFDQGNADLTTIVQRLSTDYPDAYPASQGFTANLSPLRTEMVGDSGATFYLLLGITGLVLLIACANVANLNLARMATREQELAIREALGANPRRIARQILTESVILALAGGLLGLLIAFFSIDVLSSFAARYTSLSSEVGLDSTVLIFCLVASLATGLISGSAAAFQRRNINRSLKEGSGNITASSTSKNLRQGLLVVQFSLAFIILTSATLVSLSLYRLNNEEPGFISTNILSVDMTLNFTAFNDINRRRDFLRYLEGSLVNHPQISSMGASSQIPLVEGGVTSLQFQIEGRPPADSAQRLSVTTLAASSGFFQVLGIPLMNGRYFSTTDDENSPSVVLINQAMAERYLDGENPIGKRISFDEGQSWLEIVGVVGNIKSDGLDVPAPETVYISYLQAVFGPATSNILRLFVETPSATDEIKTFIAETIHFYEPEQAIRNIVEMEVIRDSWLSSPRLVGQLITIFGILAFGITLSGVVGVVAYNISQRMKEIGIRMALGANPRHIRSMLTIQGLLLGVFGLLTGAVVMIFMAPLLSEILFETNPADISVYISSAVVILLMAIVAISLPTTQAVKVDPSRALRDQ